MEDKEIIGRSRKAHDSGWRIFRGPGLTCWRLKRIGGNGIPEYRGCVERFYVAMFWETTYKKVA